MRIRRRTLIITALAALVGGGLVLAGVAAWLLKTNAGNAYVQRQIANRLASAVNGKAHVGKLSGDLLYSPVLDSLEIRDADDSVLVATGRVAFEYDLGDVLRGGGIELRNMVVERPFVHLRRLAAGGWNYRVAFKSGGSKPPSADRQAGAPITIDGLTVRNGIFRWTEPWKPNDWLHGAARDSAVRNTLARKDLNVRRVSGGFVRMRDWTRMNAEIPRLRIRHPDSIGVAVQIARLDVDEFDPPFKLRNAHGLVTIARDTVTLDIDSFRLPGSEGSARGTIVSKDGLAVAVRVIGDTVSLADIAWLYPTFPSEGAGRMTLDIRRARTGKITDFALTKLDVSTTRSRLRGAMTFGVGERMLRITDVDVQLAPIDFKLFEQFAGAPLAMPWAGQLRGRLIGRGGPLDHFVIDSTAIEFTDGNVPGVVNKFRGAGEVDIVRTIATSFHDFALDIERFDMRTLRAVNPAFPPLEGTIAGTARLDSLWSDVRFRDLNLRYIVDTNTSRFTGAGRVTLAEDAVIYDVALTGGPLSFDALAKSYPKLTARGPYTGPFSVRGSLGDLNVTADLTGPAGRVRTTLQLDALEPRYGASGTIELFEFDPSKLLTNAPQVRGAITASLQVALRGDSLANVEGEARAAVGATTYRGVRIDGGRVGFSFADGFVHVDTAAIESRAFTLNGAGALGLASDRRDSIRIVMRGESLGDIREWLAPREAGVQLDSLQGDFTLTARLHGNLDSLDASAALRTNDVVYGATTARRFSVDADVADVLGRQVGRVSVLADTVLAGGLRLLKVSADAALRGGDRARVVAQVRSATGPTLDAGADVSWDSTSVRAQFDSLLLAVRDNRWTLARPAALASSHSAFTLDTLVLRGAGDATLVVSAMIPKSGDARGGLNADAFPLRDLGTLLQMPLPLSGRAALSASLAGTRDEPRIAFRVLAQEATVGETRIEGMNATGRYLDRALTIDADVRRAGVPVLLARATIPMDLSLRPVPQRILDAPLTGTITADSTDLAVLETFWPGITRATGRFDTRLTIGGTWREPRVNGLLEVARGAMTLTGLGVRYDNVRAYLRFFGDSVHIDTLSAVSDGKGRIYGHISATDWSDPRFELYFRTEGEFRVMNRRGVADVSLGTGAGALRLAGRKSRSVLTGNLTANGSVFVPEAISKNVVAIDNDLLASLIDTTTLAYKSLLPAASPAIVRNMEIVGVTIAAGDNLRLRSEEANIKLSGNLQLSVGTSSADPVGRGQAARGQAGTRALTLEGTLQATEGTYRLDLGPLQRSFNVQRGTVQFFGDPDIEAAIDIQALHTVPQPDQRLRQDVQILATITGTLSRLSLKLSSPDSHISESDAISYLLTGVPSIGIGGKTSDYTTILNRAVLTSLGSALSGGGGGVVSDVSVSIAATGDAYGGNVRRLGSNLLAGTRVGAGLRINDYTSARLDAGLCQFGQLASGNGQGLDPVAFADAIGGKIDVRVNTGLSLSFGIEPATSALMCAQGGRARGFVPTPRQFGFDLLRLWRF